MIGGSHRDEQEMISVTARCRNGYAMGAVSVGIRDTERITLFHRTSSGIPKEPFA